MSYSRIPTSSWLDGKILAYQLKEKEFRRGVIVESSGNRSTLLPIKTYSRRGCSHLPKEEQRMHSAINVGSRLPSTEQEPYLRVAIQASRLDVENSAKPRINYNGKFNLRHTTKVREVGQVSGRHFAVLLKQYREVHGIAQESMAASSPNSLAPSDAKPTSRVGDQEESGPQQHGDKNSANPARIETSDLAAVHSLADTPQTQQQPKAISSATTPPTPPNELSGRLEAPPLPINESWTLPHATLWENPSDPLLQQGNTETTKIIHNDVENRPTSPPPVAQSSKSVPSTRLPPNAEQPVKPDQDCLSMVALPARATPPTVTVETLLPEGNHLTPTEAICPISDTTLEEVTGSVDLPSVSQTANTIPVSEGVNLDVQDLPQIIGMFELHKETTLPTQETNDAVPDLAKKQDMWYTFDSIIPPFSLQDVVASLHFPSLTAYTNLSQTIDATLRQESEEHASAPSAAAKNKWRDVGGIPPFRLSFSTLTLLLVRLLLIIRDIVQLCTVSNNRGNRHHRTRSSAQTLLHPSLGDEPDQTYGGNQHHNAATQDPVHSKYQHSEATIEQSVYLPESSNAAATSPYTRNPPKSPYYRDIWLEDEGSKSKIEVLALVDTGADDIFISEKAVKRLGARIHPYYGHVTLGNGQEEEIVGTVGLHFGLNSHSSRWHDQFIVMAGLRYDVVFGREVNDRLKFFLVNPEMLILTLEKPDDKDVREAKRKEEENDRQVKEQNDRGREEIRARRAQAQQQAKA